MYDYTTSARRGPGWEVQKRIDATEYPSHFKGTALPDFSGFRGRLQPYKLGLRRSELQILLILKDGLFIVKSKSRLSTIHLSIWLLDLKLYKKDLRPLSRSIQIQYVSSTRQWYTQKSLNDYINDKFNKAAKGAVAWNGFWLHTTHLV